MSGALAGFCVNTFRLAMRGERCPECEACRHRILQYAASCVRACDLRRILAIPSCVCALASVRYVSFVPLPSPPPDWLRHGPKQFKVTRIYSKRCSDGSNCVELGRDRVIYMVGGGSVGCCVPSLVGGSLQLRR